ncbi:endonuclease domain-containing protein [Sphingomonas sp. PB4P5]|uniref:endonuclease domain-containing protein n=1 Tax=Parasphingomonas puruogangriensis TaxID=3096155 RepID=UPI002FC9D015
MPQTDKLLLERAKSMRTNMTQPEREIWTALRAKRFEHVKFARQVVIGPYIADFVARSRKLIIEIDGHTHTDAERDAHRTAWLETQGYRVIRFTNSDVMQNIEGVLDTLASALAAAPLPTLSPKGRGL